MSRKADIEDPILRTNYPPELDVAPSPNHEVIHTGPGIKAWWIEPVPELLHGEILEWATIQGVVPVRISGY